MNHKSWFILSLTLPRTCTLLPWSIPESFTEIGPSTWAPTCYNAQDSHPSPHTPLYTYSRLRRLDYIHLKLECFESCSEKHLRNRGRDHPAGSRDEAMSRSLAAMAGLSRFWYCEISPLDSERGVRGEAEAKVRQDLEDEEDKRQKGKQIHFRAYFLNGSQRGRRRGRGRGHQARFLAQCSRSSRLCDA